VSSRKDEAVTVEPFWLFGVDLQSVSEENSADFGAAEWQTKVAGVGFVNGVQRQSASCIGSQSENFFIHVIFRVNLWSRIKLSLYIYQNKG